MAGALADGEAAGDLKAMSYGTRGLETTYVAAAGVVPAGVVATGEVAAGLVAFPEAVPELETRDEDEDGLACVVGAPAFRVLVAADHSIVKKKSRDFLNINIPVFPTIVKSGVSAKIVESLLVATSWMV